MLTDEERRAYACTSQNNRSNKSFVVDEFGNWSRRVTIAQQDAAALTSNALELSNTLFLPVNSTAVGINDVPGFAGLDGSEVRAVIQVQDASIRLRLDAVDPTSSQGECADPKTYLELGLINTVELNQPHSEIADFRAIAINDPAVLVIRLYK